MNLTKKEIKSLNKRMKDILEDTSNHYNLNNRSVCPFSRECIYIPEDKEQSEGCGIARLLDDVTKKFIVEHGYNSDVGVGNLIAKLKNANQPIPPKIQGLPILFLQDIQRLHDTQDYWITEGLSNKGELEVKAVEVNIDGGNYYIKSLYLHSGLA